VISFCIFTCLTAALVTRASSTCRRGCGLAGACSRSSLNLNGNRAADAGVAALAEALGRVFPYAMVRHASDWRLHKIGGVNRVGVRNCICPGLKWLYLVLSRLGDEGAAALANTLRIPGALRGLEVLWCCGAFSETQGRGFTQLTSACDWVNADPHMQQIRAPGPLSPTEEGHIGRDLIPLRLELDFGLVWGM